MAPPSYEYAPLKHLLAGKKAREVGNSVIRNYDSVHFFPDAIGRAITGIIRANHKLKSEYPRLFCRSCLRRAKKIKLEYGTMILCPKCGLSRNLMTGISKVAGFIGGGGEDLFEQNGIAMVRLWFEEEKNARHADIDKIVIREGGVKNYEFAVNAVILELTADASNKIGWTNHIPVEIECSSPLSPACETMLKSNFKWDE